jgi:hypothetical protein
LAQHVFKAGLRSAFTAHTIGCEDRVGSETEKGVGPAKLYSGTVAVALSSRATGCKVYITQTRSRSIGLWEPKHAPLSLPPLQAALAAATTCTCDPSEPVSHADTHCHVCICTVMKRYINARVHAARIHCAYEKRSNLHKHRASITEPHVVQTCAQCYSVVRVTGDVATDRGHVQPRHCTKEKARQTLEKGRMARLGWVQSGMLRPQNMETARLC